MNKYSDWTDEQINIEVGNRRGTPAYDYCNGWGNAGPIIDEERITLIFDDHNGKCGAVIGLGEQIWGERALRAAMEVYLMSEGE
jgi:hypothetical protein